MRLSVIVPCYNERRTIADTIQAVRSAPYDDKEIIVVDDCSNDGTRELLVNELRSSVSRLILHDRNSGKGAALRSGIKAASGDIIILQDADREYSPSEYPVLLEPILRGDADVVFGSRFIGSHPHRVLYFWHRVGNGVLTLISNMFTNLNLTDVETGYKVFRREIIQDINIEEDRFGFEPEITAKVAKMGCRIYEVGISYHGRTYREGKKVNWKDGCRALYCIIKYNVFRRRPVKRTPTSRVDFAPGGLRGNLHEVMVNAEERLAFLETRGKCGACQEEAHVSRHGWQVPEIDDG